MALEFYPKMPFFDSPPEKVLCWCLVLPVLPCKFFQQFVSIRRCIDKRRLIHLLFCSKWFFLHLSLCILAAVKTMNVAFFLNWKHPAILLPLGGWDSFLKLETLSHLTPPRGMRRFLELETLSHLTPPRGMRRFLELETPSHLTPPRGMGGLSSACHFPLP